MKIYGQVRENGIDVENRTVDFVISTEAKDRHETIIKADGWKFDNYRNNPVVLYVHDSTNSDPDLVLGTGEIFQEGTNTIGRATFETADVNPLAEKVFRKVQNGTLRATSVGFNPISYGWGEESRGEDTKEFYFREQELLEFSIVPVPSNPEALKRTMADFEVLKSNTPKPENRNKKEVQKRLNNLRLRRYSIT